MSHVKPLNVYDEPIVPCSMDPLTGFFRDGCCATGPQDRGRHIICARMTKEFLEFSASQGNDLITPKPAWRFPGLEPGDQWCLCASRWAQALQAGCAPPVVLESTHKSALDIVSMEDLSAHAYH